MIKKNLSQFFALVYDVELHGFNILKKETIAFWSSLSSLLDQCLYIQQKKY